MPDHLLQVVLPPWRSYRSLARLRHLLTSLSSASASWRVLVNIIAVDSYGKLILSKIQGLSDISLQSHLHQSRTIPILYYNATLLDQDLATRVLLPLAILLCIPKRRRDIMASRIGHGMAVGPLDSNHPRLAICSGLIYNVRYGTVKYSDDNQHS